MKPNSQRKGKFDLPILVANHQDASSKQLSLVGFQNALLDLAMVHTYHAMLLDTAHTANVTSVCKWNRPAHQKM